MINDELIIDDTKYSTQLSNKYLKRSKYKPPELKIIYSVIPGVIQQVFVQEGQSVRKGDKLLILEAMKMKNLILANQDGTIKKLFVITGQHVTKKQMFLEFE